MASDGINLAGWSIELTDGTNVTGDLTSSGAFSVSDYVATGGGSFTNTRIGDYLVLGNVTGSGAINNDVLVTLKDASGSKVDEVEIGDDPASDGTGDGAPDGTANGGNATTTDDEAIARYPNATDTDNDVSDFIQTITTLGSTNSLSGTVVINEVVDRSSAGLEHQ